MAGNILWGSGGATFPLIASGQGTQLANGSATSLANTLDNTGATSGSRFFGLAELVCAQSGFGSSVAGNTTLDFYLVPSRDGTNFMDADTAGPLLPGNHLIGQFAVTTSGNSRMRLGIANFPLLPVVYKGYLQNNTGQNLLSGWSLFVDTYQEAYT